MTVGELHQVLCDAITKGHADSLILFDTEARCFNYHYAQVTQACLDYSDTKPFVSLSDGLPHHDGRAVCVGCSCRIDIEHRNALCGECSDSKR